MSCARSPGIRHKCRTKALFRAVAWLCCVAITLNLFVPIAWAAASPLSDDGLAICHYQAPDQRPADPGSQPGRTDGFVPHCPLCVLFGGTMWAPPVGAAIGVTVVTAVETVTPASPIERIAPLPTTLRPSPRAPPGPI